MRSTEPLPIPSWYNSTLIANPWFAPNPEMIQHEAEAMKKRYGVSNISESELRVLAFDIDNLTDFTYPLTSVDVFTGRVTRFIPAFLEGMVETPEWWSQGNNEIEFYTALNIHELLSIVGGRLSVPGAWNDTQRGVEWDMRNAGHITQRAFAMDSHPFTARFDMHFYEARANNPYNLTAGEHPYGFMDGPDKPFPLITPSNLWHPRHNKYGYWKPVIATRANLDETWDMVSKLKVVVLWFKHGHRFSSGAILDPLVMASAYHHTFLRGGIVAEPLWLPKGMSFRADAFGAFAYEYKTPNLQPDGVPSMSSLMQGTAERPGFDLVVAKGQARTHCNITTMEQAVADLNANGLSDRIKDLVYLDDCGSNIPGFELQANDRWAALAAQGLQIRKSTEFNLYDLN